ncbi:hypothetical protein NUSPORA_00226 [Nucleospora cyclopteri]
MRINFDKEITDKFIKQLLNEIRINKINIELYEDLAYLLATKTNIIDKKILDEFLKVFLEVKKYPIYVQEVYYNLQTEEQKEEYLNMFKSKLKTVKQLEADLIDQNKPKHGVENNVIEKEFIKKRSRSNNRKIRKEAVEKSNIKHHKLIQEKQKKEKEYKITENLIKKSETTKF